MRSPSRCSLLVRDAERKTWNRGPFGIVLLIAIAGRIAHPREGCSTATMVRPGNRAVP